MKHKNTKQMALVGLMAAVICITAPFSLNLPLSPVPISLGTLAIYFVVSVLGRKYGSISVIIYLLLGLAGLPVFSNFHGGVGILLGPTGGYLVGYLFLAWICGFFVDKWQGKSLPCFVGMVLGTMACYFFGTIWLSYQSSMTFTQAFLSAVVPFLPGDFIKLLLALIATRKVHRRLVRAGFIE